MSKYTRGYTKDPLQKNLNMDFEDNINFFSGKNIEINFNDEEIIKEDKEENSDDISGLENLVKSFGNIQKNLIDKEPFINGSEGIMSVGKSLITSLWQLIKDLGEWIKSLFTNKIARIEAKINYTVQRRKINGIRTGEEVRYPSTAVLMVIPTKVGKEPEWVYECVEEDVQFYQKSSKTIKELKNFITQEVKDINESKFEVMKFIAKELTHQSLKEGELVKTDILPGNRVYVILAPIADNPNAALTYYTESNTSASPKTDKFTVTQPLIDNSIKVLVKYHDAVGQAQKNMTELQREFEREVNKIIKTDSISSERRQFLAWLCNVHKRFINTTLQHAVQVINALDDFINAGLK